MDTAQFGMFSVNSQAISHSTNLCVKDSTCYTFQIYRINEIKKLLLYLCADMPLVHKLHGTESFLRSYWFNWSRNFLQSMEPKNSYPHSQKPATCPYPETDHSILCTTHPFSSRSISILTSHLCLCFPSGLFTSGFPTKPVYAPLLSPIPDTCPIHLTLLDMISQMKLGEKHRSQCSQNIVSSRPQLPLFS